MCITNQHLLKDDLLEHKQITTDTLEEGKLIQGDYLIGTELKSYDAKLTSIWRGVPENGKKNPHPAPFPLCLPARVIISILGSETQGIVLDPYIGSGTTAVAAKLLGHKYIGIDSSETYSKAYNYCDIL